MKGDEGENPIIGCVPYLNARPLVEGLTFPIKEMVPSLLFTKFTQGKLDAALLSSIDVISLSQPEVINGISIASHGEVYSVILAYTGGLESIQIITMDPASHTSNALLKIVLEEFFDLRPQYVQNTSEESLSHTPVLPLLLIGDPAISLRKRTSNSEIRYLDLGAEWYRRTGFPFVFAMWALRNEFTEKEVLSDLLIESKNVGLSKRREIASRHSDPSFAFRYMTEFIRYDLGDLEKRGLALFGVLLQKYNIIKSEPVPIKYYQNC